MRIDLNWQNYKDNLVLAKALIAPSDVMAVIKADAYGHGIVEAAKAAVEVGIDKFGVLDVESALQLRAAAIDSRLFAWLHGEQTDFRSAIEQNVELSVSTIREIEHVAAAAATLGQKALIHLNIDTGLTRNGFAFYETPFALDAVRANAAHLHLQAVWSHLADASTAEDEAAIRVFEQALEIVDHHGFRGFERHVATSPSGFTIPRSHYDYARFGISVFGSSPVPNKTAHELGLKSVMNVWGSVVQIAEREITLDVGYTHGLMSSAVGKQLEIGSSSAQLVSIAPCQSNYLLSSEAELHIGDEVLLMGDGPELNSCDSWANHTNTVADEWMLGFGNAANR